MYKTVSYFKWMCGMFYLAYLTSMWKTYWIPFHEEHAMPVFPIYTIIMASNRIMTVRNVLTG